MFIGPDAKRSGRVQSSPILSASLSTASGVSNVLKLVTFGLGSSELIAIVKNVIARVI